MKNKKGIQVPPSPHAVINDEDVLILVGKNDVVGKVTNSTFWFGELIKKLKSTKDKITITIK